MSRLFPYPLLSLGVAGLWLVLASSFTLNSFIVAAILGVALPLATLPFLRGLPRARRPGRAALLFLRVCGDIIAANWVVARQVLGPIGRLRPAFLEIPLDTDEPFLNTLFASIISLTPGTVSIDIDRDRRILLVHALDAPDPAATIAEVKARYEAPLREIFQC